MCGINGIFAFGAAAASPDRRELIATRDHMSARGPDGCGEWWDTDRRVALAHRRLAILDVSERGAQPMTSPCGRYVITYNGEIYNYPEIRNRLEAQRYRFQTSSDTEAILALYALLGPAIAGQLRGMFAFAIWDTKAGSLFLARDPYGIKPLYISSEGGTFRFASQVKALLAGKAISRTPDPAGIAGFHLWGSVPEPFTLYESVSALPAGHTQLVSSAGAQAPRAYATIPEILASNGSAVTVDDAVTRLRAASLDSVRAHLLSDVEVGVFLSAGIDSGALLGLMRDAGQTRVRAITLAFEEYRGTADDETPLAGVVARHYGADHVVRTVGREEFERDLPAIIEAMDQPSIDGINTWFVAKSAAEAGLKVALSGVGGDEILAGYPSFTDIPRWTSRLSALASIPGLGVATRWIAGLLGLGARNPKLVGMIEYGGSYPGAYLLRRGLHLPHELRRLLGTGETVRTGLRRLDTLGRLRAQLSPSPASPVTRVAILESVNYLRNQLLRDSDWAGMAHGLEIRTPFVDTTFAQALAPVLSAFSGGAGKRALALAPTTPLPDEVVRRAKTGFSVPTGSWMASQLGLSPGESSNRGLVSRRWSRKVLEGLTG